MIEADFLTAIIRIDWLGNSVRIVAGSIAFAASMVGFPISSGIVTVGFSAAFINSSSSIRSFQPALYSMS